LKKYALTFFLLIFAAGYAQSAPPMEVQEVLKKGADAAKQKDFAAAIGFFEEARVLAPDSSDVFYNLGLAESQISGRELRAIAWFGAYLAAEPDAVNAKAVRKQIFALNAKNSNTLSALMKFWIETGERMATTPDAQNNLLWRTGELWAAAGDIERTKEIIARMDPNSGVLDRVLHALAYLQVNKGEYDEARKTGALIKSNRWKFYADREIALAQRLAGDTTASDKTIDQAPLEADQTAALFREGIESDFAYRAGRIAAAQSSAVAEWLTLFDAQSAFNLENLLYKDVEAYVKTLLQPITIDGEHTEDTDVYVFRRSLEEDISSVANMREHIMEMIKK
jgi:tetratricopeptide (TPR) repeat protein